MYQFSLGLETLLEKVRIKSESLGQMTLGTEYLLEEMMRIDDGIFHFLMNEYDVDIKEVIEESEKILVLRKRGSKYSNTLDSIFKYATNLSYGKIKEEHLLLAILECKDSIALQIIMNLGLSPHDLIVDLEEIYDFKEYKGEEVKFTTNLTEKARNNEFDGLFEYDNYLQKLEVVLNKKYKNNPLIIGEAGVGKSAIVEGYASFLIKEGRPGEVLELNLSQMLANTKYRGDFEGRIEEVLGYLKNQKSSILFIDEIHTIMGAGSAENSLDVANILKPFLARSDLKIIGATTLEEYHKTIYKDKALRRRFDPILVKEPDLITTKRIIKGLKESYSLFHKKEITDETLNYLIEESDRVILNKARPDKCIDILDEVMSYANCNQLEIDSNLIDYILEEHIGYKKDMKNLHYKELSKLSFLSENNLKETNNYNYHLALEDDDESLKLLKEDLKTLFGFNEELTLELDLSQYQDNASMQTLLGAPPGYVGYQEEGILSKQILKYPMSLLILRNTSDISAAFKNLYQKIINEGFFYDNAGNRIYTRHLVILDLVKIKEKTSVGFIKNDVIDNVDFDIMLYKKPDLNLLTSSYEELFLKYNLNVKLDFKVRPKHKKALNTIIYDLLTNQDKNEYEITLENLRPVLVKH